MENVKQFQDRMEQLKIEEKQLEEILSLLRREINKCQVERMQLISQQRLQNCEDIRAPSVEEIIINLDNDVNQKPLQLGFRVARENCEEEEEDSD